MLRADGGGSTQTCSRLFTNPFHRIRFFSPRTESPDSVSPGEIIRSFLLQFPFPYFMQQQICFDLMLRVKVRQLF